MLGTPKGFSRLIFLKLHSYLPSASCLACSEALLKCFFIGVLAQAQEPGGPESEPHGHMGPRPATEETQLATMSWNQN